MVTVCYFVFIMLNELIKLAGILWNLEGGWYSGLVGVGAFEGLGVFDSCGSFKI